MNTAFRISRNAAPLTVGVLALYPTTTYAADSTQPDIASVKKSIAAVIEDDAERRGDGTSLTGTFVRLAWHCAGTYSKVDGGGGSNGARMRFDPEASWGANAGLGVARKALEGVKVCSCDVLAELMVLLVLFSQHIYFFM